MKNAECREKGRVRGDSIRCSWTRHPDVGRHLSAAADFLNRRLHDALTWRSVDLPGASFSSNCNPTHVPAANPPASAYGASGCSPPGSADPHRPLAVVVSPRLAVRVQRAVLALRVEGQQLLQSARVEGAG
jgi:hypothetical protein